MKHSKRKAIVLAPAIVLEQEQISTMRKHKKPKAIVLEQEQVSTMAKHKKPKAIVLEQEQVSTMAKHRKPKAIVLEQGWSLVHEGIIKLKNLLEGVSEGVSKEQFSVKEYSTLYSTIYDMCTKRDSENCSKELYDRFKEFLQDDVNVMVLPALREKHDEFMLRELVKRWGTHKIMVRWLSRLFIYLDRYFVPGKKLPTLTKTGLICFRDHGYEEMKTNFKDALMIMIDQEREGERIDRALLKNVLEFFVEIGMNSMDAYESDFEMAMLTDTSSYYSRKAAWWIEEDSCPDYMLKAEESLQREKERVGHYLHETSEQKLLQKVEHELLTQYASQLLEKEESGCHALLRHDKVEDLSRLYRLFSRIPNGLESVASIFRQHVEEEGTALVNQAAETKDTRGGQGQDFLRKVIKLHDKCLHYVTECFANNSLFLKALKGAFEVFCNKWIGGSTSAELLATFCDSLLKKGGNENLSDEAIEKTFQNVVQLLAYINDKDLFAEFYRKKLARRLLLEKHTHQDHERSILAKLKHQFGGQLTSKSEGMLTDLTLARDNQISFESYLNDNPASNPGIELTGIVLSTGFWPTYKSSGLTLAPEMAKCIEVFKEFYQTKTKDRKLSWIYSLGTCNINGKFDLKPIELIVTTYQAAVLLLFNAKERLSYTDIKGQLNLSDEDIVRLLHSLSCAKHKILNKDPTTKTVSASDSFEFNSKFTDKMRRVKIPLPPVDEKKKVIADVDKDRRYAIDASIVRIMKGRKALPYQQLILECVGQVEQMFKPDISLIKKRIEDLIAREYLERDKDNPKMFKYLA